MNTTNPAPRRWTRRLATPRLNPTPPSSSTASRRRRSPSPTPFRARPSKLRARRRNTNTIVRRRRGRTPRHGPPQPKASSSTRNLAPAVASPEQPKGAEVPQSSANGRHPLKSMPVPPKAVLEVRAHRAARLPRRLSLPPWTSTSPPWSEAGGTDGLRDPPIPNQRATPSRLRTSPPRLTSEPAEIYEKDGSWRLTRNW